MKKSAKILKNAAYPIAVIAIVLIAWYFAAIAADSEFILPEPVATLRALTALLGEPGLWTAFGATVLRAIVAFISSLAAALILALVSRFFKPLESLLSPLVSVLRALPTMAVVLLLIVWAGARKAPVIVAVMVLLPTLYAAFTEALGNVNRDVIDMAKIDGRKPSDVGVAVLSAACRASRLALDGGVRFVGAEADGSRRSACFHREIDRHDDAAGADLLRRCRSHRAHRADGDSRARPRKAGVRAAVAVVPLVDIESKKVDCNYSALKARSFSLRRAFSLPVRAAYGTVLSPPVND